MTKILIGSRHGGHAASIDTVRQKLLEEYPDAEFVVLTDYEDHFDYDFAEKLYKVSSFRSTGEGKSIQPINLISNCMKSLMVLLRERPDVVVAAGANSSFPVALLGGLVFRKKVIAVEAKNRTKVPSKTPKILSRLYGGTEVWVSFDSMLDRYPTEKVVNKEILQSQELEQFRSEEKERDLMIVPSSGDSEQILEEYGKNMPHEEFLRELGRTETVVTRAGNTSYEAAVLSDNVVVVPFPDPQGHQDNFADWLEGEYDNVEVFRDESFEEVVRRYDPDSSHVDS